MLTEEQIQYQDDFFLRKWSKYLKNFGISCPTIIMPLQCYLVQLYLWPEGNLWQETLNGLRSLFKGKAAEKVLSLAGNLFDHLDRTRLTRRTSNSLLERDPIGHTYYWLGKPFWLCKERRKEGPKQLRRAKNWYYLEAFSLEGNLPGLPLAKKKKLYHKVGWIILKCRLKRDR